MGLIKAVFTGAGSALSDQWKEFFCCDAIPPSTLVVKGYKRTGKNHPIPKAAITLLQTAAL